VPGAFAACAADTSSCVSLPYCSQAAYGACSFANVTLHPCAAIRDVASCDAATDSSGAKMYQRATGCMGTCPACAVCVADIYRKVVQPALTANATSSSAVASFFSAYCSTARYPAYTCSAIEGQILLSPSGALGKRAAKLCQLLGQRLQNSQPQCCQIVPMCACGMSTGQHIQPCLPACQSALLVWAIQSVCARTGSAV
jgi:hypothetical protein